VGILVIMIAHAERSRRLRRLLARLAADCGGDLAALAWPSSPGAVDGFEWVAGDEADTARAQAALAKLARGPDTELSADELDAFEAIVLTRNRPVAFVEQGSYADFAAPWRALNEDSVRSGLAPLFGAVGRIELSDNPIVPFVGTGFVVGPGLVMTNRHVAEVFCQGIGHRQLVFRPGRTGIHFGRERGARDGEPAALRVRDVVMVHPYWDMALLSVDGIPAERAPLTLGVEQPEALIDREIVVVGYPSRDLRNDAEVQDRIFARTFHVKRVQPGKLRGRSTIRSFESDVPAIEHDASTLAGNSGSAVIDVATFQVVGLHFGGRYLVGNYAVPMYELARDPRIVAAGVCFSGTPADVDARAQEAWRRIESEIVA
jgi:V8-like Glu-specific endopeptidase